MRHVVIVETKRGGNAAVEFASETAASKWRDLAETLGFTTVGMFPILKRTEVLYEEV